MDLFCAERIVSDFLFYLTLGCDRVVPEPSVPSYRTVSSRVVRYCRAGVSEETSDRSDTAGRVGQEQPWDVPATQNVHQNMMCNDLTMYLW